MDKIDKSTGASYAFSAKAMELAKKGHSAAAVPFKEPERVAKPKPSAGSDAADRLSPSPLAGRAEEGLSVSAKARELASAEPPVATTVDAGAPKGSSKRISAYGDAQRALAPKGGGFEGLA